MKFYLEACCSMGSSLIRTTVNYIAKFFNSMCKKPTSVPRLRLLLQFLRPLEMCVFRWCQATSVKGSVDPKRAVTHMLRTSALRARLPSPKSWHWVSSPHYPAKGCGLELSHSSLSTPQPCLGPAAHSKGPGMRWSMILHSVGQMANATRQIKCSSPQRRFAQQHASRDDTPASPSGNTLDVPSTEALLISAKQEGRWEGLAPEMEEPNLGPDSPIPSSIFDFLVSSSVKEKSWRVCVHVHMCVHAQRGPILTSVSSSINFHLRVH